MTHQAKLRQARLQPPDFGFGRITAAVVDVDNLVRDAPVERGDDSATSGAMLPASFLTGITTESSMRLGCRAPALFRRQSAVRLGERRGDAR